MTDLAKFLDARLRIADAKRHTDSNSPPWWEDGVTIEIDEATYFWFLDQLAPRYQSGDLFAFGNGAGDFKLFWGVDRRHFAHQLSPEDTDEFCRLTRVALHQ